MKISIDQQTDYSRKELYRLAKDTILPDFVKSAALDEDLSNLSKEAFAEPHNRSFPINTAANTYISNLYFLDKKAALADYWSEGYISKIEENIKRAAAIHGIEKELEDASSSLLTKQAADYDEAYIFTAELGGKEVGLFPVKTAAALSESADFFSKHLNRYPFNWRAEISENFVKRAKEYGVDELPDIICKYAGMFYPNVPALRDELKYRALKLDKPEDVETFGKLAEALEGLDETEQFMKVAEVIYYTEKLAGAYEKPNCILRDPVDVVFSLPIEKVAEILDVVEMAGEKYAMDDLTKVPAAVYEEAFGIDVDPTKAAELRDILPTMPRSDVTLFKDLSGVRPI